MPAKSSQIDGLDTIHNDAIPNISTLSPLEENFIRVFIKTTRSKALIDTGASLSCISQSFLYQAFPGESISYKPSKYKVVAGVGGEILKVLGVVEIPLEIQGKIFNSELHVFQKLHKNLILGKDFLSKFKANIDFHRKTVQLDDNTQFSCFGKQLPSGIVRNSHDILIPAQSGMYIPVSVSNYQIPYIALLESKHSVQPEGYLVAKCAVKVEKGQTMCQILNPTAKSIRISKGKVLASSYPLKDSEIVEVDNPPLVGMASTAKENISDKEAIKNSDDLNIDLTDAKLSEVQKRTLKIKIGQNRDIFAKDISELGAYKSFTHTIETGEAPPQRRPYYRSTPMARKEQEKQVEEMLKHDIIEPSDSMWQAPVVLVKKPTGEFRFAVDYRQLNNVTKPISQSLPRFESIFDSLGDAQPKFFTTLDMSSGFWQLYLDPKTKHKTTFTTPMGNYNFKRMPFGLVNAPASYTIMMNKVLQGLNWKFLLCYMDDILIFSSSFEEHLNHLDQVFEKLREANLTLKPSKCKFATDRVLYLGHYLSQQGIEVNDRKIEAVKSYPKPTTLKKLRGFLGLCSYYRRFIKDFAKIASPLYKLLKKDAKFEWTANQEDAFLKLKDLLTTTPVLNYPDFSKPFKLTSDASGEGIGYYISQVNDAGEEHPITYGGRALRDREKRYSATDLECLALVEGIRNNHVYLAHKKFVAITDHNALQYLKNVKVTSGRLYRWALELQNYDFEVKHKPGAQNKVADALSRRSYEITTNPPAECSEEQMLLSIEPGINIPTHTDKDSNKKMPLLQVQFQYEDNKEPNISVPDPIVSVCTISSSDLGNAQKECPDFKDIYRYLVDSELPAGKAHATKVIAESDQYIVDNGILYHLYSPRTRDIQKQQSVIRQLVLPRNKRHEALQAYHDSLLGGGHFGFDRTYQSIRQKYYWPKMYKEILDYIEKCDKCQRIKNNSHARKAPLTNMPVVGKFERWHMDFIGPLTEAENGSKHILLLVDSLTRWPEAFALKSQQAPEVAKVLYEQIFSRYGAPRVLVSDRGQTFMSKLVTAISEIFNVKRHHTSPYHPQTNSTCERFNSTLEQALRAYVKDDHSDWPEMLPGILMSYRKSPSTHSTRFSPYSLVFGSEMNVPYDTSMTPKSQLSATTKNYIQNIKQKLDQSNEIAKENIIEAQQKSKEYYDRKTKEPTFKIGDFVLVNNPKIRKNKSKKMDPKQDGPYIITHCGPNHTYKLNHIQTGKDKTSLTHANRLKAYSDPKDRLITPQVQQNTVDNPINAPDLQENPVIQMDKGNPEKVIEKIENIRKRGKVQQYKVRFKDTTFEWKQGSEIPAHMLREYHAKYTNLGKVRKAHKLKRLVFR